MRVNLLHLIIIIMPCNGRTPASTPGTSHRRDSINICSSTTTASAAKTPHRRRRKIPADHSNLTTTTATENKENESSITNDQITTTMNNVTLPKTSRSGTKPRRFDEDDDGGNSEDLLLLKQATNDTTYALKMMVTPSSSSATRHQQVQWLLNDSELRSSILELSLRLPIQTKCDDNGHGVGGGSNSSDRHPMRLLQHANHVHDHCNGLLKEAKRFLHPEPENHHPPPQLHGLFLALHCVRAVVHMMALLPEDPTDIWVSRQETCLKLLYHVISGAEGAAPTTGTATSTIDDSTHKASARPCWIVLAAVEALQRLLVQYNSCCDSGLVQFSFSGFVDSVVPSIQKNSAPSAPNGRRMTLRQVMTIGCKAYLAAATAIKNLRLLSLSLISSMEGEASTYGAWALQWTLKGSPQEFLPLAYRPWLAFVLSSHDADSLKDIIGHAKAGHRFLWDLAANVQSSVTALTIRQASILILLPSSPPPTPESKHPTPSPMSYTRDLFEAACGYAWKAATVFAQQPQCVFPVSPTSPLGIFHVEIGTHVDRIAPELKHDGDDMAFEEYCVYRAMHCGIRPQLLLPTECTSHQHQPPQPDTTSLDDAVGNRSVILPALLVAIEAQHHLFDNDAENTLSHSCFIDHSDISDIGAYCDYLTGGICAMVQRNSQCLTLPMQNRYFKLISALSIHRTIFQAITNRNTRTVNLKALEIVSLISSKGLGPLMLLFARTVGDQDISKRDSMLDAAMECYVRPLAAFELLRESFTREEGSLKYEEMANRLISSMYQLFFQQNPPLSSKLLEKCAKSMAMVGRQRSEQIPTAANSCLLPSLYAVSIFRYLSDHQAEDSSSNQYQLTARLAHLACAFQSSELHYEAMIVHSFVLAQELPYCYEGVCEIWRDIDFLEFLASRCKNALLPCSSNLSLTALGKSSIRRIISAADTLSNEQGMCSAMDSSMKLAWKAFLSSNGCLDFDQEHHDNQQCRLLPVARLLSKVLSTHEGIGESSEKYRIRIALLLIDLMLDVGASMDRSTTGWQAEACRSICDVLPTVHSSIGHGLVAAVIQVVASTSLTQSKTIDFSRPHPPDACSETLPALAHLHEALALLHENQKAAIDLNSELLAVAIRHLQWHVDGRGIEGLDWALFERFQVTMDLYINGSPLDGEVGQFCRRSFLWALSHFQWHLESCRDPVRSIMSMHWLMKVDKGGDKMDTVWSQTAGIDIIMSNPLSSVELCRFELLLSRVEDECAVGSPEWFAQMELELALQRMRLTFGSDQQNATSILQTIRSFLLEAEEYETSQLGQRDAASKWILCNLHFNLTEHCAAWGNFAEALAHSKEACRYCMAVVSLLRFGNAVVGEDIGPHWAHISRSTLLPRAKQRYAELLCLRSRIYSRVGDHRKAVAYLATYSNFLGFKSERIDPEPGLDIQVLLNSHSRLQESDFRRLNAEIRCSTSSLDFVAKGLEKSGKSWLHEALSESSDTSRQIQVILDILSVGDLLYGESIQSPFEQSFRSFYSEALNLFSKLNSTNNLLCAFEQITGTNDTKLSAKIAIREVRCLLSLNREQPDDPVNDKLLDLCTKVIDNAAADKTDRAWALYYSADATIGDLRRSGSLELLWNGEEDALPDEDRKGLERARVLLATAISLHVIGSDILSRILLRTLALVAGPEVGTLNNASAGALVLMSIGQSYRQQMIRSLSESDSEPSGRVKQLLGIFDLFDGTGIEANGITHLLEELAAVAPDNWKFVAMALSPSGDALITHIENDPGLGGLTVKTVRVEPKDSSSAYNDIMIPLDEIVEASQKQLQGMDVSAVSERFSKEEAKRTWWDNRHMLDEKMLAVVERVESNYFPSLHVCTNSGESIFQVAGDSENLPIGNLASRFEAAVEIPRDEDETNESLRKLTVPTLKELLRDKFGFSDSVFRKMKKQDLIDLYLKESRPKAHSKTTMMPTRGCLFLLLDENLHRFPFEGMPSLMGNPVCRVPSLSFVLATLLDRNESDTNVPRVVDPSMASFVLDPEGNLISSRNRIRPVLERIEQDNNWDWSAVVGEMPSASFFENGLCQPNGLFMYFGHGGAQTCFSRKQVESLIGPRGGDHPHEARACRSTVILMGCSSGRLVSVNRKHSQCLDQQIPLYYEPEGIALSYLCAGAPCVVGNLWDVTDGDIDRFSTTLLESFLVPSDDDDEEGGAAAGMSLASCVARSRSVCKLRYMVGCAPVCYGVPVHVLR